MPDPKQPNDLKKQISEPKNVSRRNLLKTLAAGGGAVAITTMLPGKWIKPIARIGVLPAHAQCSVPVHGEMTWDDTYIGQDVEWTVPNCVYSITVLAVGASGGTVNTTRGSVAGGLGGRVNTTLAVNPGQVLSILVGEAGGDIAISDTTGASGGSSGTIYSGGDGGDDGSATPGRAGAGGGGGSFVRLDGNILVAGAGGGGGSGVDLTSSGGGGGADTGQDGGGNNPGLGGTQVSGGSGGNSGTGTPGSAGSQGNGGDGGYNNDTGGGGGGGGYYGGGGGAGGGSQGGGGGGGSNHPADGGATTSERGVNTGDGYVTITW